MKQKHCDKCDRVVIWQPDDVLVGKNYIEYPLECLGGNSLHFCERTVLEGKQQSAHTFLNCKCLK